MQVDQISPVLHRSWHLNIVNFKGASPSLLAHLLLNPIHLSHLRDTRRHCQSMREPYLKLKFGELKRVDTSIPLHADENSLYL